MSKFNKMWYVLSRIRFVVSIAHLLQFLTPILVAFWALMTGMGQDISQAQVIATTAISLGGTALFINQFKALAGFPLLVSSLADYSYCLGYEGVNISCSAIGDNALQVGVNLKNLSTGPMRFKVERFDVVIGDRTLASGQQHYSNKGGFVPSGGLRHYKYPPFKRDVVQDFLGKSVQGSIEFDIVYGHPDGALFRRLKMKLDITISLSSNNHCSVGDVILEECDEQVFG